MKGLECRLIEYMESSKKRFIIPVYQRNYDWKTDDMMNCWGKTKCQTSNLRS